MTEILTRVVRLAEAINMAASSVEYKPGEVTVELEEALDTILVEDFVAKESIPPRPRAEVDGFAVRSEDLLSASEETPVKLKLTDGSRPGGCMEINTGQYLPDGYELGVYARIR